MKFLEKDLEQIIYEADKAELRKRGLNVSGKLLRQLKIGNYGVADLVEVYRIERYIEDGVVFEDGRLVITVYELKKEKINVSSFMQAIRYAKGIKRYIEKYRNKYNLEYEIRIVLIGKKLDVDSSFCYFPDLIPCNHYGMEFISIYTYMYDVNGISFKFKSEYSLIEEGF